MTMYNFIETKNMRFSNTNFFTLMYSLKCGNPITIDTTFGDRRAGNDLAKVPYIFQVKVPYIFQVGACIYCKK